MDNILIMAQSDEDAIQKIKITREIFADAGIQLREFLANSEGALSEIDPDDRIVPRPKFLGIDWSIHSDTMSFKFPFSNGPLWTMRSILRIINANFDPLGLTCPATYSARLFFQSLWEKAKNLKWDTPIDDDAHKKWTAIIHEWKCAQLIIHRFTGLMDGQNMQLHIFSDASKNCYATSIYARITTNGTHKTQLIFAKSRLAPKNMKDAGRITIPKMELLGILIGIRAGIFVKNELSIQNAPTFLWSDSEIALYWISSTEKHPTFIENRCKEIRASNFEFRHVPGEENPADLATRGISPQKKS